MTIVRILCLASILLGPQLASAAEYLSPSALVVDPAHQTLYVAESTAKQIAICDLATSKVQGLVQLPDAPGGLALSPDGAVLYASGVAPAGRVYVVDVKDRKWTDAIEVGHSPCAMAISPKDDKLYVCNRFSNNVSVVSLTTKKETARIEVLREPASIAITPGEGHYLLVANALPVGPATGGHVAASVSIIDTAQQRVVTNVDLPNGSTDLHGICVSPDGRFAYVVHTLARYFVPATQLDRGWMNTSALSIIDVPGRKLFNTVLLDEINRGAANPWGISCSADGNTLCVTHAGTHELSVIDRARLHQKLDEATSSTDALPAIAPADDLTRLNGVRERIALRGRGPRDITFVGATAYVTEFFSDSIGAIALSPGALPRSLSVPLGPARPLTMARRGEIMFHDADRCYQKWQSCASCHPGGRADGLNWDLMNDGIGNPKNNRSLMHVDRRKPVMSLGVRENSNKAVHAGFKAIQFTQISDDDNACVLEFLKTLKPVPSPYLVNGRLSAAAQQGKKIFTSAGCANCHSGADYTDLKPHDLGHGTGPDVNKSFITAPLTEVWRTAPYLYDGRAATMRDVFTTFNPQDKHGVTSNLSPEQLNELVEYVLSL